MKMEGDVEVEIEPTDSDSGCGSLDHGHLHSTPSFQLSALSSSSRRTSFEHDVRDEGNRFRASSAVLL